MDIKLWFISGVATDEQVEQARREGWKIRNALAYKAGDFVEKCEEAKGDVPEVYKQFVKHDKPKSKADKE